MPASGCGHDGAIARDGNGGLGGGESQAPDAGRASSESVDGSTELRQIHRMDRQTVIDRLKRNQANLKALGLARLSLFGSTARGQASATSDIDLAVTLDKDAKIDLFRFAAITEQLTRLLGTQVDLIVEPARNPRMQAQIDQDRLRVY